MKNTLAIQTINTLFDLQNQMASNGHEQQYTRVLDKLTDLFSDSGWHTQNPIDSKYIETRTDIEATIVGKIGDTLKITQVLKPIIYYKDENGMQLIQKGIVIVENK